VSGEARGFEVLSLDDVERYPDPRDDGPVLIPLRHRLGLRAFGANCWTADPGRQVVPRHREASGDEELYVVVRGHATFTVDEETVDAPSGTLVHVPAGTVREAVADEPGTIVLAAGATPGEAFVPRGWEEVVMAFAKARAGDLGGGRTLIQSLVAREPDAWQGPYNAACFEAVHGERQRAFEYLHEALRLGAQEVREFAPGDDDLAGLRDDPRWAELFA
jgi:quercetin dioxygenase-like cupin family protein